MDSPSSVKMISHFGGFHCFVIPDNTLVNIFIQYVAREPAGSTTVGALLPEQEAIGILIESPRDPPRS